MHPTYDEDADAYRDKVQAFLAEKLPADWGGIGRLDGDELDGVRLVVAWRAVRGGVPRSRAGRSSTAAPGSLRSSR